MTISSEILTLATRRSQKNFSIFNTLQFVSNGDAKTLKLPERGFKSNSLGKVCPFDWQNRA